MLLRMTCQCDKKKLNANKFVAKRNIMDFISPCCLAEVADQTYLSVSK